jgi:hypothetical protein
MATTSHEIDLIAEPHRRTFLLSILRGIWRKLLAVGIVFGFFAGVLDYLDVRPLFSSWTSGTSLAIVVSVFACTLLVAVTSDYWRFTGIAHSALATVRQREADLSAYCAALEAKSTLIARRSISALIAELDRPLPSDGAGLDEITAWRSRARGVAASALLEPHLGEFIHAVGVHEPYASPFAQSIALRLAQRLRTILKALPDSAFVPDNHIRPELIAPPTRQGN